MGKMLHPYRKYRQSAVQWIGDLPEHWGINRVRNLITKERSGTWGEDPNGGDDDIVCIRVADFDSSAGGIKTVDSYTRRYVPKKERLKRLLKPHKSFLIEKSGGGELQPVGRIVQFDKTFEAISSNFISSFETRDGFDTQFFLYLSQSMYSLGLNAPSVKQTTGIQNLDTRHYFQTRVPFPPLSEQRAIADFLDRETARIDGIVEKEKKLIELLKEKRSALITRAVTKGLDPDVKMKPSGVEWVGPVPKHWDVIRIRKALSILTDFTANGSFASLAENVEYLPEGYSRLVRLTDLRENLENEGIYVDEHAHRFLSKSELSGGEILLANVGAYTGFVCMMPTINMKATLGPNMYLLKFKNGVMNRYIYYLLSSGMYFQVFQIKASASAQPKINKRDVKDETILIPPVQEQRAIAALLDRETSQLDAQVSKIEEQIGLLDEYKRSVTTAAVTGKIDVRGMQNA